MNQQDRMKYQKENQKILRNIVKGSMRAGSQEFIDKHSLDVCGMLADLEFLIRATRDRRSPADLFPVESSQASNLITAVRRGSVEKPTFRFH